MTQIERAVVKLDSGYFECDQVDKKGGGWQV